MLTRRDFLAGSCALACSCALFRSDEESAVEQLRAIGERTGGRLGVSALDTGTGRRIGLADGERFAMASTFKLPLAAAVLERCERGVLQLDQPISYDASDLVPHAPETEKNLARGSMTVAELCAAIVTVSDNPAANLLLEQLGGPAELTRFLRSLGDQTTRLDRIEPALNENAPGDPRDTTSPRAMVDTMQRLLLGAVLRPASREKLIGWLIAAQTGLKRIRAGLPSDWRAGDKTGTGANGAVNDVAIAWPRGGAPIVIAIYMSESEQGVDALSAAHAEIARIVVGGFARR
jgi:beta-lactamase class A